MFLGCALFLQAYSKLLKVNARNLQGLLLRGLALSASGDVDTAMKCVLFQVARGDIAGLLREFQFRGIVLGVADLGTDSTGKDSSRTRTTAN